MAFVTKDWRDFPDITTPITGASLEDVEQRLANYVDSEIGGINGSPLAINGSATVGITTSQLLVANATRIELAIYNNSPTATVYVGRGAGAVVGAGDTIPPGGSISITTFTGAVNLIATAAATAVSYVEVYA